MNNETQALLTRIQTIEHQMETMRKKTNEVLNGQAEIIHALAKDANIDYHLEYPVDVAKH